MHEDILKMAAWTSRQLYQALCKKDKRRILAIRQVLVRLTGICDRYLDDRPPSNVCRQTGAAHLAAELNMCTPAATAGHPGSAVSDARIAVS